MDKIWIGTSGWTYSDWLGKFYPPEIPKNRWFEYYAQQFNAVELNATFYRQFPEKTFRHWYELTPPDFKFVVKLSRYITHVKRLVRVGKSIRIAEQSAQSLMEKLGLVLLQLPPNLAYRPDRLMKTILQFSDSSKVAVEFRNRQWFTDEIKSMLTELKVVFCNIDSPNIRVYDWLTSHTGYIRLHGHTKMYDYNYHHEMLAQIQLAIKKLQRHGAKEVYIFFNNDHHAYAPLNAQNFKSLW